jgi:hypothetical protein
MLAIFVDLVPFPFPDGDLVPFDDPFPLGLFVGIGISGSVSGPVGFSDGISEGAELGRVDGIELGTEEGSSLGISEGSSLGPLLGISSQSGIANKAIRLDKPTELFI